VVRYMNERSEPMNVGRRKRETGARKMTSRLGKLRTRAHVLADLSINFLERQVLLCGHTLHRVQFDYGYDLAMSTYSLLGEIQPGLAFFQVKATYHLPLLKDGKTISWPVSRRDLKLWLRESYPVILVVYDGQDRAYWLPVQSYFLARSTPELFTAGDAINVQVSVRSRIDRRGIQAIVQHKRDVNERLQQKEQSHD
jgi:hypothetical protein